MKACVKVYSAPAVGAVTETITGIVDRDGAPFTTLACIILGYTGLNAINRYAKWLDGFDGIAPSTHWGNTFDEDNDFALKDICGAFGDRPFLDLKAQITFGGVIEGGGYISAARSGEIDITFDGNTRPGAMIIICLGGDDLQQKLIFQTNPAAATCGFEPVAVINKYQGGTGSVTTGGSGGQFGFGWATKSDGHFGAAAGLVESGAGNERFQRTDKALSFIDTSSSHSDKTVSVWGSNGLTFSGDSFASAHLALGGIQAVSGTWSQGDTSVVTGLDNKLVIVMSFGHASDSSILTDQAEICIGVFDGSQQASYWTGEITIGDSATLKGARYMSDATGLRFATPNGSSTAFNSIFTFSGFNRVSQSFTGTWASDDSSGRQLLYIALGDIPQPPNDLSGIYKVVKDKTNDTVYSSQDPITTEDVAIPNPFAMTHFIGDEQ